MARIFRKDKKVFPNLNNFVIFLTKYLFTNPCCFEPYTTNKQDFNMSYNPHTEVIC